MKHNSILRRFLAILLVLCSLVQYLPIQPHAAETEPEGAESTVPGSHEDAFFDHIRICKDGEEVSFLTLPASDHLTLNAVFDLGEAAIDTLTWQIYDPHAGQWVPISGAESTALKVGAALLSGLADADGTAVLNCKIIADNRLYYSDAVRIALTEPEPQQAQAPSLPTPLPSATAPAKHTAPMGAFAETGGDVSGGELITRTVTVEYVDVDGNILAQPYTATVKGQNPDLSVNPKSPTIVGYTPYIITEDGLWPGNRFQQANAAEGIEEVYHRTVKDADGNETREVYYGKRADNLRLTLTDIPDDLTFRVVYLPNKMSYTVSHYIQNVANDNYVLYYVETLEGYVGELTDATDLTVTARDGYDLRNGFIALQPFQNIKISADGTAQVETYYDRRYYLLTFKLDGGYGTEPIYARYGAPITVRDPQRHGYQFEGWYRLQMERTTENGVTTLQPRPLSGTDQDGNTCYYPVYTDANGKLLDLEGKTLGPGERFVNLVKGPADDWHYYLPTAEDSNTASDKPAEPMESQNMPTTMQSVHAAMIAVWSKSDSAVTVVYWLEKPDYQIEACDRPHTTHAGMPQAGENDYSDFDYWCSTTLDDIKTGDDLAAIYKKIENPLLPVVSSGEELPKQYYRITDINVDQLHNQSFAIVTERNQFVMTNTAQNKYQNGLQKGTFNANIQTTEWTFVKQDDGKFKLHCNNSYLQLLPNNNLNLTTDVNQATAFVLTVDSDTISLQLPNQNLYVSEYGGGTSDMPISGWEDDAGRYLRLYSFQSPPSQEDRDGTGAAALTSYEIANLDNLKDQSFALVAHVGTAAQFISADLTGQDFELNTTSPVTEWTFVESGTGYKLKSGTQYLRVNNRTLTLTNAEADATVFTVTTQSGEITLSAGNQQLSYADEKLSIGRSGTQFTLYSFTRKYEDPEANYYYYYYSDLRPLDEETNTAVETPVKTEVTSDGETIVNVYFRRREYNLRFFYARSYDTGRDDETGKDILQYEVIGGSSYGFSIYDATKTEDLLRNINRLQGDTWGAVEKPVWKNTDYYEELDVPLRMNGTDYTYHALILTVRYGQDIADEWPSDIFDPVERTNPDSGAEIEKRAVFSAWNGEYWLKYSTDEGNKYDVQPDGTRKDSNGPNYTIKGNYQQLDKNLLYDPSFSVKYPDEDPYYLRGTQIGDVIRYLDFVAFWENGNYTGWSVPSQYHYYLWIKSEDQSDAAKAKAIEASQLPDRNIGVTDSQGAITNYGFDNMVERDNDEGKEPTTALFGDDVYVLYDKIDCCDNSDNPSHQTVPGIPGYRDVTPTRDSTYPHNRNNAVSSGKYYYRNAAWDTNTYQNSCSLHFRFEPLEYTITLQNHDHVTLIGSFAYGSMDGAEKMSSEYSAENLMGKYYPDNLMEGAYVFGGWYKSPECLPGGEALLYTAMPKTNIILYAKWVPRRYSIGVYQTSELKHHVYYQDGTEHKPMTSVAQEQEVQHPNYKDKDKTLLLPLVSDDPTKGKEYGSALPVVVQSSGPNKQVGQWSEELGKYERAEIPENMSDKDVQGGTGDIRPHWIFVCWAYMKDGVEYAIDTGSYQIHEDVKIYAKWTATGSVYYKVEYKLANLTQTVDGKLLDSNGNEVVFGSDGELYYADENGNPTTEKWVGEAQKDENGNDISIADAMTGLQTEGANRTFTAKTGAELYAGYQAGYFPLRASHTVLMQLGDRNEGRNRDNPLVDTFYYIKLKNAPYQVYYLDAMGNSMVDGPFKRVENPSGNDPIQMVVTEKYVYCPEYVPDAFQKTLILSANPQANKIIFHYAHTNGRPYYVVHYTETTNTKDYDIEVDGRYYDIYYSLTTYEENTEKINVPIYDISGLEYDRHSVIEYNVDSNGDPVAEEPKVTKDQQFQDVTVTVEDLQNNLTNALNQPFSSIQPKDGKWYITCGADKETGTEATLDDAIFYYKLSDGTNCEVRDITQEGNSYTLKLYHLSEKSFEVPINQYGTEVQVFYNLKEYPYFVYHQIYNGEILQIQIGKAKFQEVIRELSWTETQLIEKGHPGYTMDSEDKTLTMTMTMTIRDNDTNPKINAMIFNYYEKSIEYNYEVLVLTNPGTEQSDWKPVPLNDANAKVTTPSQNVPAATGNPYTSEPLYNNDAYAFAGWFLDPECQQAVISNDKYARYMGTGFTSEGSGSKIHTLTGALTDPINPSATNYQLELAQYKVIQPQKFTGMYYYNELQSDGTYSSKSAQLNTPGLYVGAMGKETGKSETEVHTNQQTFYALYVPKQGTITITRENLGADFHNEANSFVYRLTQLGTDGNPLSGGIVMDVTIDPADFFDQDGKPRDSASVVITNLPFATYTVTQCNDWSWRYTDTSQTITIGNDLPSKPYEDVVFETGMDKDYWLSGFAEVLENVFGHSQS